MRTTRWSVLRKKGFKLEPLTPVSLRVPVELWEKCGWAAESVGLNRTEFVRNALAYATKDTQPPENAKSRMILASAEEWRAWQAIATHFKVPVNELVCTTLNHLIPKAKAEGIILDD